MLDQNIKRVAKDLNQPLGFQYSVEGSGMRKLLKHKRDILSNAHFKCDQEGQGKGKNLMEKWM